MDLYVFYGVIRGMANPVVLKTESEGRISTGIGDFRTVVMTDQWVSVGKKSGWEPLFRLD